MAGSRTGCHSGGRRLREGFFEKENFNEEILSGGE